MNEQTQVLPERETYDELAKEAKSRDEVIALREMAQRDLTTTAVQSFNEGGDTTTSTAEVVTGIGADKLKDIHAAKKEEIQGSIAVNSEDWHNEEK